MHRKFNDFIHDRNGLMSKSPYTSVYNHSKGWSQAVDAYRTPFSQVHFDRAKEETPEEVQKHTGEFNDNTPHHFKCSRHAEMVSEVWYDEEKEILKVQWVKNRTGKRGATEGNLTYYDHCHKSVFDQLHSVYLATGHCGKELWNIIRFRGDSQGYYPYTDA